MNILFYGAKQSLSELQKHYVDREVNISDNEEMSSIDMIFIDKSAGNIDNLPQGKIIPVFSGETDEFIEILQRHLTPRFTIEDALMKLATGDSSYFLISELASGINHYYLNIMTSLMLSIDMLEFTDEKNQRGLDKISSIVEKMVQTIETLNLLKLKKPGSRITSTEPFSETEQFVPLIADYLNTHNTKVKFEQSGNIEPLALPENMLVQLFLNTILFLYHSNADRNNKLNIIMRETEDYLALEYSMSGEGITPLDINNTLDLKKLEDPFQRIYANNVLINISEIRADYNIFHTDNAIVMEIKIPRNSWRKQ